MIDRHSSGERFTTARFSSLIECNLLRHEKDEGNRKISRPAMTPQRDRLQHGLTSLKTTEEELGEIVIGIREECASLVELRKEQLSARRELAQALEAMDADVRLDVVAFRDREDFERRREEWFGGTGLQERDWKVLCDFVFSASGQVPDRIVQLVAALRSDMEAAAGSAPPP